MTAPARQQGQTPPSADQPEAGASLVPESFKPGLTVTLADLRLAGERLFGRWGWQTRLAEALEVDGSTVRRWVSGAVPVPNPAKVAIRLMLASASPNSGTPPTDKPAALPSRPRSTDLARES